MTMDNPTIQTNLAEVLGQINRQLEKISETTIELKTEINELKTETIVGIAEVKGEIRSIDEKLSGQINTLDTKLSGQINTLDTKLSGQINTLDTKVEQLDKRISNSEFTNRGILIGIIVIVLGGAAKFFGLISN